MKKFFHDYSYSIIKLFVNQIAIAIFGIALFVPTFKDMETLCIIASVFSVLFYLFLIYMPVWEIGAKDRISVDVGKKPHRPHLGLLISLCANIPNLILATFSLFIVDARLFATLIQGMYWGTISKLGLNNLGITYFLIIIPALLTCWLAYYLGYRNFKISSIFTSDKKDQTEKKTEAPKIKK